MRRILIILKWIALTLLILLVIGLVVLQFIDFRTPDEEWKEKLNEEGITARFGYTAADSVHYVSFGDTTKPVVLFAHGSPGSWDNFLPLLKDSLLRANFHMIGYDRPGFGYTQFGIAQPDLNIQAAAIAALVQELVPDKQVILVGHSYGGPVIAQYAGIFPKKVAGLVFIGASVDPAEEEHRWFNKLATYKLIKAMLPEPMVTSNEEILPLQQELIDQLPLWSNINCPVMVIHGEKDNLVPVANAYFIQEQAVGADTTLMVIIPEAGHLIPFTQPEIIKAQLLNLATPQ